MQWMMPWTKRQRRNSPSPSPTKTASPTSFGSPDNLSSPAKNILSKKKKKSGRILFGGKRRRPKPIEAKPAPDDAPWRIENILVNGPPSVAEWWEDVSIPDTCTRASTEDDDNSTKKEIETATTTTASVTTTCSNKIDQDAGIATAGSIPTETKKASKIMETDEEDTAEDQAPTKKFHNHGFEAWTRAREAWRVQTVEERPPTLLPVANRHQVAKGLNNVQRKFDLPQRMALNDLVSIYVDIWEGDED